MGTYIDGWPIVQERGERYSMANVFSGYRLFACIGWVRSVSYLEFVENPDWEYYDSDENDGTIIAYNIKDDRYAWVEGSED